MSKSGPATPLEEAKELVAPTVPDALADIPGGETRLIPASALSQPLKVTFPLWQNSMPSVQYPESVRMFLDEVEVADKQWTVHPIQPDDLFVNIPIDKLVNRQGPRVLRYDALNWSGDPDNPAQSDPVTITIDTFAPTLASPDSQLDLPDEVLLPNKLTAHYLEMVSNDQLPTTVPRYHTPAPGHRIVWYWGERPGDLNEGGFMDLDEQNYSRPLEFIIPGELIRNRGDGWRYVSYRVWDRAGNPSAHSGFVELDVAATPIPRLLPWPDVEKAVGAGEQQTLDPLKATSGAVVVIPDTAVIYPQEQVWVQWGLPGSLGAHRATQPITSGSRRYEIPMPSIAAYIGKTLPVSYGVIDAKEVEWPSVGRKVNIQSVPSHNFPTVQCQGLTGGSLSYRTVPATGAVLKLGAWTLMTADQWIMINMTGTGATGEVVYPAIPKRKVTDQEVIGGIGMRGDVTVSKAFLNTLRRNGPLTGKVYVSFDGGRTWPSLSAPNFPLLQLTLID